MSPTDGEVSVTDNSTTACMWKLDDPDYNTWGTECGHFFSLDEGTPTNNRMAFCCYCGKPIKEIQNAARQ